MPYPAYAYEGFGFFPSTLDIYDGRTFHSDTAARYVNEGNSASTNNGLRLDKTRAMASFSRWGSRMTSDSNIEVISYYSNPAEWFKYNGPPPCLDVSPRSSSLIVWNGGADQAALKAFASWGENKVAYSDALRHAGDTAKMVGDFSKGIAHGLDDLMHQKVKQSGRQVMRQWKKLPGWYLEYLYGWKPLADDIENAVDQLSDMIQLNDSLHVILKGRWSGRAEKKYLVSAPLGIGWEAEYRLIVEQRNEAQFRYNIPNSGLENVQPLGFFGTLWEGSKASFVVDWLAPFGSWLTALDANALAPYFLEGCVSQTIRTISIDREIKSSGGWNLSSIGGGPVNGIKPFSFSRSLRGPDTLSVGIPIRNPLSLNHAAQGLSLLSQVMKSWF